MNMPQDTSTPLHDPATPAIARLADTARDRPATPREVASQRSSFAVAAGSVQAVLPAAVGTRPAAWLEANYVTLLLTGQFLPHRPIPGPPALLRQYGVAPEASRKAVRALVAEGLAIMVEGRGAYVAQPRYPSTAATASN